MTSQPKPGYRPCVGILLFNKNGQVWIGKRLQKTGKPALDFAWQMPQGGIDPGEEPYNAAVRELYEETNIRSISLLAETDDWKSYDIPEDVRKKSWKGQFKGQTQKWFAFRFDGDENEINIETPAEGAHKPEFEDWRWEDLAKVPALIVPFKRALYQELVTEFSRLSKP
ncbi:RNA pyrophosphohydrolase [Coralliovum pocilloporae]|uniref:RNA pyrophosphohydrolase n=1 Tax=Coralliovum pocilloporae TaxID=3066369 RepID=UPI003307B073